VLELPDLVMVYRRRLILRRSSVVCGSGTRVGEFPELLRTAVYHHTDFIPTLHSDSRCWTQNGTQAQWWFGTVANTPTIALLSRVPRTRIRISPLVAPEPCTGY